MKLFNFFLILSLFCLGLGTAEAAKPLARLDQELNKDSDAASTLVSYPENVRQAAMEAAAYPSALWELNSRQTQSQDQFQKLISSYPRKTQEQVYELSRYPELVADLVEGGQKSKGQIKELTKSSPKNIQEAAQDLGRNHYTLLRSVRDLYSASDRDFDKALNSLPSSTQSSYRTLLGYPELLSAMQENRDFTLALGDAYRSDPGATRVKIDEFSQNVSKEKEAALADYRQTLEKDPQAREELKKSAKAFAKEYNYDVDEEYYPPPSDSRTVVQVNINPYPYWFGYPYWYAGPIWRPYPLWWYTGFWGWGSGFYVWSWPSYYYTNWFYGYPRNFYSYPYLSGCYAGYYNRWRGRPYYNSGFSRAAGNWHNRYRYQVNDGMYRNDGQRADRWRQFGQSEEIRRRKGISSSSQARTPWKDPQQTRGTNRSSTGVNENRYRGSGEKQNSSVQRRDQGKVFSTNPRSKPAASESQSVERRQRSPEVSPTNSQPRARPSRSQQETQSAPTSVSEGGSSPSSSPPAYSGRSRSSGDSGYSAPRSSGGSSSAGSSSVGSSSRSSGGSFSSGGGGGFSRGGGGGGFSRGGGGGGSRGRR